VVVAAGRGTAVLNRSLVARSYTTTPTAAAATEEVAASPAAPAVPAAEAPAVEKPKEEPKPATPKVEKKGWFTHSPRPCSLDQPTMRRAQ
jgi:hypothetical protein